MKFAINIIAKISLVGTNFKSSFEVFDGQRVVIGAGEVLGEVPLAAGRVLSARPATLHGCPKGQPEGLA